MSVTEGPDIVETGLVLYLDATNRKSYISGSSDIFNLTNKTISGSLINGPIYNSSNGESLMFDGNDDYINFGNILNLGINNCTLNVWLKINSTWPSGNRYFISKSLAAPQSYRYAFGISLTRQLRGFVQGNGGSDVTPNTILTLNLNQWYMCTMVINRSSIIQLYLNSILQTVDSTSTISQWNELDFQSNNPFRVGSYTDSNNISPISVLPCNMSLIQIYFRVLTSQEIQQNYNATKGRFGL